MPQQTVELIVDGASSNNQIASLRCGGWAAILILVDAEGQADSRPGSYKEISGTVAGASNQEMELEALRQALLALKTKRLKLRIYSDSAYVIGLFTEGHKAKKHQALIAEIKILLEQHSVSFEKVKGHSGHSYNERADALAVAASKGQAIK